MMEVRGWELWCMRVYSILVKVWVGVVGMIEYEFVDLHEFMYSMVIDKIWVLQNLKHDVWEFYSFYGKSYVSVVMVVVVVVDSPLVL